MKERCPSCQTQLSASALARHTGSLTCQLATAVYTMRSQGLVCLGGEHHSKNYTPRGIHCVVAPHTIIRSYEGVSSLSMGTYVAPWICVVERVITHTFQGDNKVQALQSELLSQLIDQRLYKVRDAVLDAFAARPDWQLHVGAVYALNGLTAAILAVYALLTPEDDNASD